MVERKRGTIINISSVSDRKTWPAAVAYSATKYAVRALSESLREAEGKNGVRVVNIAPGYVRTKIHKHTASRLNSAARLWGTPTS